MSVKNNRVDIKFFLFPNLTIAWDTPSIFRKMRGWKPLDLSWTKWARERKEERELDKRMARAQAEQVRKAREARAEADRIDRLWFAANGLEIVAHIDDWQFVIPVREFLRGPKWDRPVVPAGTLRGWGVTKHGVWQFYEETYRVTMAGDTIGFPFDMGVYSRSRNLGMESFEAGVVCYSHGMQYQTDVYPEPYKGDARRKKSSAYKGMMNDVYQHYEAKAREKNDATFDLSRPHRYIVTLLDSFGNKMWTGPLSHFYPAQEGRTEVVHMLELARFVTVDGLGARGHFTLPVGQMEKLEPGDKAIINISLPDEYGIGRLVFMEWMA